MRTTEILAGFYVYGAICYALIGAAAISWHDSLAFAVVIVGAALTALSYMVQAFGLGFRRATIACVLLGWVLPASATVLLMFGVH